MQVNGVLDGKNGPKWRQAALRDGAGCLIEGTGKGQAVLEDMSLLGEDGCAQRNHRLIRIMQLPPEDRRGATYSFLRGDTPLCLRAGRVRQPSPWKPFDGLMGDLHAAF